VRCDVLDTLEISRHRPSLGMASSSSARDAIAALSGDGLESSRSFRADGIRIEVMRCRPGSTMRWQLSQSEASLIWVQGCADTVRLTLGDRSSGFAPSGRANLCFVPDAIGGDGEMRIGSSCACAGVFVEPAFVPRALKSVLAAPMIGFHHESLSRAFAELLNETARPDTLFSLFAQGWTMQALAYVARAAQQPRPPSRSQGLALWQLRRAKEMLLAELGEKPSLNGVAQACRLSRSRFSHAFKASTGLTPHQWLIAARVERARALLKESETPLVEIACICGFADQSHFTRVFARRTEASPSVWRLHNRE
jgi:AraC family transcriptional regulator